MNILIDTNIILWVLFDRIFIREAIRKGYNLLSRDSKFKHYKKYGLKLL